MGHRETLSFGINLCASSLTNALFHPSFSIMSERSTNIIEQIFEMAKEREKTDSSVNFDVYTQENQLKPQFAEVCCRWSDAAYRGDWDDILKVLQDVITRVIRILIASLQIVAANIWNAPSLANLTRLRKKDHNPNHKPSG